MRRKEKLRQKFNNLYRVFLVCVFFEIAISQPIFNIFSIGKKLRYLDIGTFLKLWKLSKLIKN